MTMNEATVADEPMCTACRYNLHGQRAARNAAAARWETVCPECGTTNVVRVDDGRPISARSYAMLGGTLIGVYFAWQLLDALATAEVRLAVTCEAFMQRSFASMLSNRLDELLVSIASILVMNGLGIVLAASGVGALVSLAPYGQAARQARLAIALVIIGCLIGVSAMAASMAPPIAATNIRQPGMAVFPYASPSPWYFAGAAIGILIAIGGARIGLRVGRPAVRMIGEMFLPPELRPSTPRREVRR